MPDTLFRGTLLRHGRYFVRPGSGWIAEAVFAPQAGAPLRAWLSFGLGDAAAFGAQTKASQLRKHLAVQITAGGVSDSTTRLMGVIGPVVDLAAVTAIELVDIPKPWHEQAERDPA